MKKLALVALLGLAMSAAAVDGTDISGTICEVASGDATFVFTNLTAASADATVKLVPPLYGGRYIGNFRLYVTDVTVTIDAMEVAAASQIRLSGDIVTFGSGKVIVKGVTTIAFGNDSPSDYTSTSMPVLDADFAFADAPGGGLVLVNGVTLKRRPTCTFSIADGAGIGVRGENVLGDATGGLAVDRFNLFVLDEPGCGQSVSGPITVSDGQFLVFKPCSVNYDSVGRRYAWSGGNGTLLNAVELAEGATMYVPTKTGVVVAGAIGGKGTISIPADSYNAKVEFSGDSSAFAGSVDVRHASRWITVSGKLSCGSMSWARGANLTISDGAKVSVGTFAGEVKPLGAGAFEVETLQPGAFVHDGRTGTVIVSDQEADVLESAYDAKLYARIGRLGETSDLSTIADALLPDTLYSLTAKNGGSYINVPQNVRIMVPENASATVLMQGPTNTIAVAEGGTLKVKSGYEDAWKAHVMKWIDPNVAESITVLTNLEKNTAYTQADDLEMPWYAKTRYFPELDTISDCREGFRNWALQGEKALGENRSSTIFPLLITNAVNGLSVLSFGAGRTARRTSYYAAEPDKVRVEETRPDAYTDFYPKFAVLVFGSQGGGGQGLFANQNSYFLRGGTNDAQKTSGIDTKNKDQPIFKNAIPTWVDGVRVDATVTPFSGGWQILSVDCSGATAGVRGLGYPLSTESKKSSGGQVYAEVIFFDEVLGDEARVSVERYLANKWGLADRYQGPETGRLSARLEGSGAVTLEDNLALEGGFVGTVNANGHALTISGQPLPPGEEVVTAAHPDRWFDPEYEGAVQLTLSGVENLYDRLLPMPLAEMETDQVYLSACGRWGKLDVGSRGGSATNWISYIATTGNLRFRRKGETTGQTSVYNPMDVKTVFLVQDSTFGGGTPFQLKKDSAQRIISRKNMVGTYGRELTLEEELRTPIWNASAYQALRDSTKATTYLDGHPVDGATVGFGGKPEVFSVISSQKFKIGTFADLYYNNEGSTPYPTDRGVVQSEIILFESEISEANRCAIEAYLAWKWLGEVREGYTELSKAQLTGEGTVVVPTGRPAPQFGADFTGTAVFAANTFDFTVTDADAAVPVTGLIDVGGGAFAPHSPCTLAVTVADGVRLKSGAFYPLVKGVVADGVELTLNIAADAKGRELKLESRDGVLGLAVGRMGLLLLVK